MNKIYNNILVGIGNTPLIKLRGPSKETGCNIYGKAEFLNPGGSIKDRAALAIIKDDVILAPLVGSTISFTVLLAVL